MNVCTRVEGTVAKQDRVGTGVDETVAEQNSVGTGGASARQQQASWHGGQEANKADASNGGIGVLEQRKNGGMERRRRQSKRKDVVGGGLGMDSSADKGAGRKQVHFEGVKGKRLSLKHDFGCIDSCCIILEPMVGCKINSRH